MCSKVKKKELLAGSCTCWLVPAFLLAGVNPQIKKVRGWGGGVSPLTCSHLCFKNDARKRLLFVWEPSLGSFCHVGILVCHAAVCCGVKGRVVGKCCETVAGRILEEV